MPPPDSGKKLNAREKELLRAWIAQGAEYAEHWAFIPPENPEIPRLIFTGVVYNEMKGAMSSPSQVMARSLGEPSA